jgi:hypothetical protein
MNKSRLAGLWLAAMPLVPSTAMALDPTLPQPGKRPPLPQPVTLPAVPPAPVVAPEPRPAPPIPASAPATSPGTTNPSETPATRSPIPDAAAQREANRIVDQVYKETIAAARSPEQKRQLGQRFYKLAMETTSDLPGKYVLLIRARDLASDAGDVDTTLGSIAETEKSFAVEAGAADMEVVARLQKNLRGPEPHRALARYLIGAANDALVADRFEAAKRLADLAVADALRSNDTNLQKLANARTKEIREIELAYTQAKPALAAIAKGSTDDADSLIAGRYKCLYKGDWTTGLPLLATSNDAALKDLATKELTGVAGADQQLSVGDAWWDQSEKLAGVPKNLATVRARYWYEQAEPYLTGLPKAKAQRRLKESEALALLYGPKGLPVLPPAPPSSPGTNAPPAATGLMKRLPPKFTREWKFPPRWLNKPELVTIAENRVSIINEGGTNQVCKDEEFIPQPDGSLVLQWNYGEMKTGYEIWKVEGTEISILRWDNKEDKDAGKAAKRTGFIRAR